MTLESLQVITILVFAKIRPDTYLMPFYLCCATGLPGVLFVLPDSYVDPEYKDYGGSFLASQI